MKIRKLKRLKNVLSYIKGFGVYSATVTVGNYTYPLSEPELTTIDNSVVFKFNRLFSQTSLADLNEPSGFLQVLPSPEEGVPSLHYCIKFPKTMDELVLTDYGFFYSLSFSLGDSKFTLVFSGMNSNTSPMLDLLPIKDESEDKDGIRIINPDNIEGLLFLLNNNLIGNITRAKYQQDTENIMSYLPNIESVLNKFISYSTLYHNVTGYTKECQGFVIDNNTPLWIKYKAKDILVFIHKDKGYNSYTLQLGISDKLHWSFSFNLF